MGGEAGLVGGGRGIHILLQLGDLSVVVGDGGVHSLDFQLGLLDLQLGALGVVDEERIPLGHPLTLRHQQLAELFGSVEFYIFGFLGFNDTAVAIGQSGAGGIHIGDGLDIDPAFLGGTALQQPENQSGGGQSDDDHNDQNDLFFASHGITSIFIFPVLVYEIIIP